MIVSFIADLKLTPDNKIKILEFGSLQHSGFLGYSLATGGRDMRKDVVYPYIRSLGYPNLILNGSNTYFDIIDFLEQNKQAVEDAGAGIVVTPPGATLSQITMMMYRDYRRVWFHNHEPVFMMAMDNKAVFMGLCSATMNDAMPEGGFYLNDISESHRQEIEEDFTAPTYVLKMPEAAKGIGTMIVDREQIFDVMHAISNPSARASSPVPISPEWDDWYSPLIIWQEKVDGKPLLHRGKLYDPTMRVVMTAHKAPGQDLKLEVHDAYWKFPKAAIGEQASLQDRTVSYSPPGKAYAGDFNASAEAATHFALVSEEDRQIVWDELHRVMPGAIRGLLDRDAGEFAHQLLDLKNPSSIGMAIGVMAASMGNYFDGYDTVSSVLKRHFPPGQPDTEMGHPRFVFPDGLAMTMRVMHDADPDAPWSKYLRALHSPRRKHMISPQFYDAVLKHIPQPTGQLELPLFKP